MGVMTPPLNSKPVKERTKAEFRNKKSDFYLKTTNTVALCLFAIVVSGWLFMNCKDLQGGGIFHSIMQNEFFINIKNINNQTIATLPIIRQNDVGLSIWLVLSGTITFLLLLKTLNYLSKFWAIIGIIFEAVLLVLTLFSFGFVSYTLFFTQIIPYKFYILLTVVTVYRLASFPFIKIGRNFGPIIESLKKTSHVAFSYPSVFLFGIITGILIITVIAFTAVSFYSADSNVLSIISLLGGIYLVAFIVQFTIEITNEYFIILNRSKNKKSKSGCILLKSIGVILREESGCIIIWCTIIVPLILVLIVCCCKMFRKQLCSRSHLVQSWVIANGLNKVLPGIASDPAGVPEETKKIFNLVFVRSHILGTAFAVVFANVLFVFSAIGMIISAGIPFAIFQNSLVSTKAFIQIAVVYYGLGTALLFAVVFATVNVASGEFDYNIAKEEVESVRREMLHNEDKESKKCVIDQTQEPSSLTVV